MGAMDVDETKLNEFLGKAVGDLGAAMSATLILVGDRLGLYRELAKGAMTSAQLAQRTGTDERYVREWLGNQGAGGYVQYDPASDEWSLSPEQALCLTDPNGPVDMPGAYNIVEATFHALEHTLKNFKSGARHGVGRTSPVPVRGNGTLLPRRLQHKPDRRMAARPRRRRREIAERSQSRRRRLRARREHHPDGEDATRIRSSSATTTTTIR